ncbi:hypothetical protein E4T52_12193 [Aureobasidium sp. EXF-3400]|nr:hypothetical protein E4T51_08436 [Aureobasidium sp. EXF-12344]KAI4772827.1 hypothetical protein E4T52_12193 [Aureobasidium sp. EXF-3400]
MPSFSQLPLEVQQNILDHLVKDKQSLTLRDRQNLLAPMRVNSFWFHYTADILWNKISRLETTFKHMGLQDDRRQLYVSKIRILILHTARIYFDLIQNLKFDSLTHLSLRGDHMGIMPFLQPNLKTIIFNSNFDLTSHELSRINVLCPHLHELHILPPSMSNKRALVVKPNLDPIDCNAFRSFFNHSQRLRSLTIGSELSSSLVSAALVGLLPLVASQLEELILKNVESAALPPNRQTILEACTSLRKFEIRRTVTAQSTLMPMLLGSLATNSKLKHLRLDHDILEEYVKDCVRRHDAPFGNLQSLALKGNMLPVSRFLLFSMESLTRLQLVVDDHGHHICPSLSRLQNLTYLNIVIGINRHAWFHEGARYEPGPQDWQATTADMHALSALSKLESLSIRPMNINLTAPWMTDDYFGTWTSKFPCLQDLEIDIECPVSFAGIVALSKHHPHLRRCKLLWIQGMEDWHALPLTHFKNLQQLKLNLAMDATSDQWRAFVLGKFNMVVGGMGIKPLMVDLGGQHPSVDGLKVMTLDVSAATHFES